MLAHADEARAWLADAGLRDTDSPDSPRTSSWLATVRESLRAMIGRNTGGPPLSEAELRTLQQATTQAAPRVEVTASGHVRLETGDEG